MNNNDTISKNAEPKLNSNIVTEESTTVSAKTQINELIDRLSAMKETNASQDATISTLKQQLDEYTKELNTIKQKNTNQDIIIKQKVELYQNELAPILAAMKDQNAKQDLILQALQSKIDNNQAKYDRDMFDLKNITNVFIKDIQDKLLEAQKTNHLNTKQIQEYSAELNKHKDQLKSDDSPSSVKTILQSVESIAIKVLMASL